MKNKSENRLLLFNLDALGISFLISRAACWHKVERRDGWDEFLTLLST